MLFDCGGQSSINLWDSQDKQKDGYHSKSRVQDPILWTKKRYIRNGRRWNLDKTGVEITVIMTYLQAKMRIKGNILRYIPCWIDVALCFLSLSASLLFPAVEEENSKETKRNGGDDIYSKINTHNPRVLSLTLIIWVGQYDTRLSHPLRVLEMKILL